MSPAEDQGDAGTEADRGRGGPPVLGEVGAADELVRLARGRHGRDVVELAVVLVVVDDS
ncbi:MAG TPA: hypothetical protein VGG75_21090 [Trebonia sp.]